MKNYYRTTSCALLNFKLGLLVSFIFIICTTKGFSQVNSYAFSESLVGYTPLVGGTVAYAAPWDNETATEVTLPFAFTYNYNPVTQFYISANGFISFGTTQPVATNYLPMQTATAHTGVISALGTNLVSNGSDITYGVVGVAPNRTMVVQWTNAVRATSGGDFNFQIRLNESDNSIVLSYGLCSPLGTTLIGVQVGLRGETNVFAQGDVFNRLQSSTQTWLGTTIAGIANSSTNRTVNTSPTIQAYPDLGLQYRYVPAPLCVTPPAQPSGLLIGATSITHNAFVGNSFTAPATAPTNYLVVRSFSNVAPTAAQIVNGVYYLNGTTILPDHTVVSNNTTTTFTSTGLTPNTTYYYWVIPYNNLCGNAPIYNLTGIISGSQTTCSQPTVAAAATNLTGNGFDANWSVVASATDYRLDVATDAAFTALVPGYNNLSVGLVNTYTVAGLLPLTTYYYRVRAVGSGCLVNSNTITVANGCGYYTIPYTQNFDSFTSGVIPPCYTRDNVNADAFQWNTQSISFSSAPRSLHMAKSLTLPMDDWFFLPGLQLTGGTSYRLFFRYNTGNTAAFFENLRVRLGNGASIVAMNETLLDLPNINNNTFQVAIVDFVPVITGVYYLGFQGYSPANQTYISIDDVSVTLSPLCFEPTDLVISNTTTNTADVSWTASNPAPANGYQYYVSTSSTPPNGATIPTGSVGAGVTSVTIPGLTASTAYYIWVRGNCSASAKSVWSLEESFSTDCVTPTILSSVPGSRCGFGTVTLSATPNTGSVINWYSASFGGSILFTGNNFTTPAIGTTTTYYAESKAFGPIAKVGPTSPTNQGGVLGVQNYQSQINFSITGNTTFQALDIYPMVSGQAGQIAIRNSANITIASFSYTTAATGGSTPQTIVINTNLVPGNYNLYFAQLPASGLRNNVSNSFYPYLSSVANILGNLYDNTYNLGTYNWRFTTECLSPRQAIVATVSSPPVLGISSAASTICENTSTPVITVSGYGAYNSLNWSPNTNISGSFAAGFTFNPSVTTTYTLIANQTSGALCGNTITHTVTVNPAPAPIAIVPAAASICQNAIQALSGTGGTSSAIPVFTENFNAATNGWTVANTSIGGDVTASQWTLRPHNYNYINGFGWNVTFNSNDSSQFYLANSDSQSAVPGSLTRTTLTSPTVNLAGYTGASLNFHHFLRYTAFDTVLLEISTNGGTSWSTLRQYTSSYGVQGVPVVNLATDTVNLDAYVGNSNLRFRFNYTSPWGYVWAIDNFVVSGTLATALTWTPITNLYTDAAATIPYVAGTALSVVYAQPSTTTTYTATVTALNGCFRSNTVTLNVTPSTNAGTLSSDQLLCTATTPSNLTLAGNVGNVVRWEYASNAAFTVGVTTIANTTTTLTPAQMGVFTTIRYFRAVVRNGICNEVNSNVVFVSYPSTTWNGTTWSNGVPTSSTVAIFNGAYSSLGDLNACAVLINSGTITFNSNHTLIVQNNVNVAGGALIFENNSSLVQINSTPNTGNITYKRNTTPMRRWDYTYWSTPVTPQTLLALSPLTLSDKYFKFDPVFGNWVNVPANTLMDIAKGYIIRGPQTFSTTVPSIYNGSFFGVPNNGTYTTPIFVSTSTLNLIGNPYPSALSADLFLSDPANVAVIDATIYLWTHNTPITANQYTNNDYALYNYMGGVGTSSINTGVNNSVPTGKIASGQAFFLNGLSNGVATYRNSMRLVGDNTQFFRMNANTTPSTNQELEKHRIWIDLIGNETNYKQALIGYCENATNEIDRGFDSTILTSDNPINIYSLHNTSKLSIQGKALPFDVNDRVPLGFVTGTDGSFRIRLFHFDGLFETQNIYLEDKLLNVIHDLKEGDYSFVSNAGVFEDRFELIYLNSTLSTPQASWDANAVVLYMPAEELLIDSGNVVMDSVKVYDVRGRLIAEKKKINATETSIDLGRANGVYLIQITSETGQVVTKKYMK
jgi:Ig-like domain CHU_C associated/Secretion system C-terminal sorting domain/Fibronectin type III domain